MTAALQLENDGAVLLAGAALSILDELEAALAGVASDQAGVRLHGVSRLPELLQRLAIPELAGRRAVRAILFDKSAAANWTLGWHQDRTIAVKARADLPGFGPCTVKQGLQHVEPPFALIEAMRTIRIHLDAVDADNAPLRIVLGSHRLGKLSEARIEAAVAQGETADCLAERGDVWLYATPIVHASAAAPRPSHRRVLQVDFARAELTPPLEWLGL